MSQRTVHLHKTIALRVTAAQYRQLQRQRRPGESLSDCLRRLLAKITDPPRFPE